MKFVNERTKEELIWTGVKRIEVEIADNASLPEIFEGLKGFLQASGYLINGDIEVVEDQDLGIGVGDDDDN